MLLFPGLVLILDNGNAIKIIGKTIKGNITFKETLMEQTTEKFRTGTCMLNHKTNEVTWWDPTAPPSRLENGSCLQMELKGIGPNSEVFKKFETTPSIEKVYKEGEDIPYQIDIKELEIDNHVKYYVLAVINQGWCSDLNHLTVKKCDFFTSFAHHSNLFDWEKCLKNNGNICEGPKLDLATIF